MRLFALEPREGGIPATPSMPMARRANIIRGSICQRNFILCRSWASRAITTAIPDDAGAGYWHLHCIAKFKGAKVTPPFRQVDDPDVILENYLDDTHGFMRVEIEDDSDDRPLFHRPASARTSGNAAARRRFVSIAIQGQQTRALSGRGASRPRHGRLRRGPCPLADVQLFHFEPHINAAISPL